MDQAFGDQLVALLPKLRRFARSLTGSVEEGDDLVQSACERALQRQEQFEPGSRLDSWMYRIVQTVWIDRMRQKSRLEQGVDPAVLARHPGRDGPSTAEDRVALAETRRAIARLPAEQREALVLVSVEGMSYRQAAVMLGLPLGTLMSRLARARLALAKALEEPTNIRPFPARGEAGGRQLQGGSAGGRKPGIEET